MKKTLRVLQIILHIIYHVLAHIFIDILSNSLRDIKIKKAQRKQINTEMYLVINHIT